MLPKTKTRLWIVFLAMALPAYLGGAWLSLRYNPDARLGITIDRAAAIARGVEYAREKGFEVKGWTPYLRFRADNDLHFYYRHRSGAAREMARGLVPEAALGIKYLSPDKKEVVEVDLDMQGRPLNYRQEVSRTQTVADPGEEAARKVALAAIRARMEGAGQAPPGDLPPGELVRDATATRRYVWKWPLDGAPELTVRSEVLVRGGRLAADRVTAKVASEYAGANLHADSGYKLLSLIVYSLLLTICVIFGIFRFVQRVQQKEVSYTRSIILAVLVAVIMNSFLWVTDVASYDSVATPDFPAPEWIIIVTGSVIYLIVGLLLGLAYGSGEGDIREPYPGKLASLDAFLTGRIFSRNVARAIVIGWAIGGWMFLLANLSLLPWQASGGWGEEIGQLDAWFGQAPWLFGFVAWMTDVILVIVMGLLIPLPFVYRRFRSHKIVIASVLVMLWIACSAPYLQLRPWEAIFVWAAPRAVLTLLAFLEFDLLTAVIALGSPTFIGQAVSLMAQPSPELNRSGMISLGVALLILVVDMILSFKGKTYLEEEIRPVYAKNLAERLSMQAEVSAAREAQIRLMPEHIPSLPQLTIAAECLPAFEVGGDFYDLIELESGKIGILIAEGGGKGLGSALSIAFAKGFLMPKIKGLPRVDASPTELMRALQDQLTAKVDEDSSIGFALAVIDPEDRSLRYARTGDYPRIHIGSPDGFKVPTEIRKTFRSNYRPDETVQLIEGQIVLQPRDNVVFFTDGIARMLDQGQTTVEEFFGSLPQEDLPDQLTKAVNKIAKRSKRAGSEDDLTAVIVRLD